MTKEEARNFLIEKMAEAAKVNGCLFYVGDVTDTFGEDSFIVEGGFYREGEDPKAHCYEWEIYPDSGIASPVI